MRRLARTLERRPRRRAGGALLTCDAGGRLSATARTSAMTAASLAVQIMPPSDQKGTPVGFVGFFPRRPEPTSAAMAAIVA